jgi:hypothetical protein
MGRTRTFRPDPGFPTAQPTYPMSSLRAHGSLECRPPLSDPSPSSCLNPAPCQSPRRVFLDQHPPLCGSSPLLRGPCGWEIATTSRKKNPDSGNHIRPGSPPRHRRWARSSQQTPRLEPPRISLLAPARTWAPPGYKSGAAPPQTRVRREEIKRKQGREARHPRQPSGAPSPKARKGFVGDCGHSRIVFVLAVGRGNPLSTVNCSTESYLRRRAANRSGLCTSVS